MKTASKINCKTLVNDSLVYDVTRDIFQRRSELQEIFKYLELKPITELGHVFFPVHPGAKRYFEREKPGFLEKNFDLLQLIAWFISGLVWTVGTWFQYSKWKAIHQHKVS